MVSRLGKGTMKIDELMNKYYGELNENERYLCKYLSGHKKEFVQFPIDEIARRCGVSKSLLVRFSKRLGLNGFRELKALIRMEEYEEQENTDDLMKRMTDSYHKMIDDFRKRDYTDIFEAIEKSERVIVYGSGSSQARVASELKRIFLPKKTFINLHGHDMCQAIEKNVQEGDIVFLISLSGEADYMIQLAKRLRVKGIFLVSITRMSNNTLSSCCTENLYIESVYMEIGNYGEYESSTPYFILMELFYLAYRNYLNEREYANQNE